MLKKLVLSIICSFTLLAGCADSSTSNNESNNQPTIKTIEEKLSTMFETKPETVDQTTVEHLLNLETNDINSAVECFDSTHPELLFIIVESKDETIALSTSEALQNYLDSLKQQATMYDGDQLKLIENGFITTNGKFSILVIAKDSTAAKKELLTLFN